MQPLQPPAAQLLYDLGLEMEFKYVLVDRNIQSIPIDTMNAPWPPPLPSFLGSGQKWTCPPHSLHTPLLLRILPAPVSLAARAARVKFPGQSKKSITADVITKYLIGAKDLAMVYISPDPIYGAFEEELDLQKFDISRHSTTGLIFFEKDQRLFLASMAPGTPGAHIPWWHTRLHRAWLITIDETHIHTHDTYIPMLKHNQCSVICH
jgi:hypothetical protein